MVIYGQHLTLTSTQYYKRTHSAGSTGAEGSLVWAKCIPLSVLSTSVYKSARSVYCAASVGWVLVSVNTLATSVVAAFRKQPDIAIGNVVGSNVFNILGILGISAMISPLSAPGISLFDYSAMMLFTVILIPLLYTRQLLQRIEGGALLLLYGLYLFMLWPN